MYFSPFLLYNVQVVKIEKIVYLGHFTFVVNKDEEIW